LIEDNEALTRLSGLENITSVNGDLVIEYNDVLISVAGLENIRFVGGSLTVEGNVALIDFDGLENLITIGGNLKIRYNNSLKNIGGLGNVCSVGGLLTVSGNHALTGLIGLHKITSLGGGLTISANRALNSLIGLNNITSIAGGLSVIDNDDLYTLAGLAGLTIMNGALVVRENARLISISELGNINASTITGLTIIDNPSLPDCAVRSVCDYLSGANATVDIRNNLTGCNHQDEVEEACKLAVKDIFPDAGPEITPNPLYENAILTFNATNPGTITIDIFNPSGICVGRQTFALQKAGQQEIVLDMNGLAPGIYFLRIKIAETTVSRKVVKL
jgi:hypothetical protein